MYFQLELFGMCRHFKLYKTFLISTIAKSKLAQRRKCFKILSILGIRRLIIYYKKDCAIIKVKNRNKTCINNILGKRNFLKKFQF